MIQRTRRLLLACLCLVSMPWTLLLGWTPAIATQKPALYYFFENYCSSCAPEEEFAEEFATLTGEPLSSYDFHLYNLRYTHHRAALEEAIAAFSIPPEQQKLPLLIVDGAIYAGSTAIHAALPADALARDPQSTDSVVYYLYVTACESCAKADATLKALPDEVTLTRGDHLFTSPVRVERVNIGEDTALALALFDAYNVPEAQRVAPIAFVKDQYFSGSDAIARFLPDAVQHGAAVGNRIAPGEPAPLPPLAFGSTALAGLIGGLNPCALSMLLLFVSLLLPLREHPARYAAAFLASKFVCYLLIGTLLLSALRAWSPAWLPTALKAFLSVYCAALVLLNLWDARVARREAYGAVRNQLPARLRGFLHRTITRTLASPKRLLFSALLLGAAVSVSEFLCAGQVYLATLLTTLHNGVTPQHALLLVVYCAAFIAPSTLLCVALLRGKAMFAVSEWVRRRMPLVKLVTAIFFACVLAAVWVL